DACAQHPMIIMLRNTGAPANDSMESLRVTLTRKDSRSLMMRRVTTRSIQVLMLCSALAACTPSAPPPPVDPALQQIADRTLIRELMDRYGTVHDSGTPDEYADLFTAEGEIAIGGGPVV